MKRLGSAAHVQRRPSRPWCSQARQVDARWPAALSGLRAAAGGGGFSAIDQASPSPRGHRRAGSHSAVS